VIVMENHDYSQVIDSPLAPYENQLASQCGLATNYTAVAHPSLPNYIAMTSGSTQGITDNGNPGAHPLAVGSIFGQVKSKSYQESMPANCYGSDSYPYSAHHNPEPYYTLVAADCAVNDVPMGSASAGNLLNNVNAGTLPAFSFVTPNQCNNTHDCGVDVGDSFLATLLPKIFAGPDYQAGRLAVFLTWDENDDSPGNHVPMIVASPYTAPGTQSSTAYTHYSFLRTVEEALHLPLLANAASANSMLTAFNLAAPAAAAGWATVYRDDFTTDAAAPANFGLYVGQCGTPQGNVKQFDPRQAWVQGGLLHMRLSYLPSGPCGANWYSAGMMIDQQYGGVDQAVELRYRIVSVGGAAGHLVVPMRFPDTTSWPAGGEEDGCEGGESLAGCSSFIHYACPGSGGDCQTVGPDYSADLTQWHTWRFESRSFGFKVYLDGVLKWSFLGNSTTVPATVKRLVLQQECSYAGCPGSTSASEDVQVDWVQVDKPA
jgi:phosphatidylinositol-3-phosphatase